MRKGAFQTSREIFNNQIWNDIPKFRIFFFIVGNAVFAKDGIKHAGMKINRGQYLRSYRNLQEDLSFIDNRSIKKYSLSVIKKKVDELIREKRLKKEDSELGTLFTVVNYEQYQALDNYKKGNLERRENAVRTQRERSENNNKNVKNVNKKDSSQKQVYDNTSIYYNLSNYFLEQIRKNNPDHKEPNLQKWSDDVRKIIELDERTPEQVKHLIKWVQHDDFEYVNVLSPNKLRKRFDHLVMKVKKDKGFTQTVAKRGKSPEQIEQERQFKEMQERIKANELSGK